MNDGRIFKANEFITLKLEDDKTNLYVLDKLFKQCMTLVLNIPTDNIMKFDTIHSIDDIEKFISLEEIEDNYNSHRINPEAEFQAHCSNITAWIENEYKTEILHRTIAFPLLKSLVDAGDSKAKKRFKEEIAYRFMQGNYTVKEYLILEGYIDYLTREEFFSLFPFGTELAKIEKLLHGKFVLGEYPTKKLWLLQANPESKYIFSDHALMLGIENYRLSTSKWNRILNILGSIKSLEMLHLRNNKLERLPKNISKLKHLKSLNLFGNKIKKKEIPVDLQSIVWGL